MVEDESLYPGVRCEREDGREDRFWAGRCSCQRGILPGGLWCVDRCGTRSSQIVRELRGFIARSCLYRARCSGADRFDPQGIFQQGGNSLILAYRRTACAVCREIRESCVIQKGRAAARPFCIILNYPFNTSQPAYLALSPSSASMRINWLYFATRSERAGAPVLIWPVLSATAISAIVASSVSPERCDVTARQPAR